MSLQISCTLCSKPFSAANPPRIAKKCPHTYCQACIKTAEACPMDKIPFEFNKLGIESFHINRTIVKMLKLNLQPTPQAETTKATSPSVTPKSENKKESQKRLAPPKPQLPKQKAEEKPVQTLLSEADQSNKCLLHNKQLDLVCIDHAVKVCSNCALFGEHKNHNVKPIQALIGQCACIAQQTLGILTDIKEHQKLVNQQNIQNQIIEGFKAKRQEIVKAMRTVFTKIIDKIRKQQKALVSQLDKMIEISKEQILNSIKFDQCSKKKQTWINDAKDLLKIIDSFPSYSKVEQATQYLKNGCQQSTLVQRGGYVLVELEMFDKIFQQKLLSSITDLSTQTSPLIDTQIQGFYKIYKLSQKDYQKQKPSLSPRLSADKIRQKNEEDQLLEELNQFPKQLEYQYNGGYGYNTFINTTDASSMQMLSDLSRPPMQYLNSFDQPTTYLDSFNYSQNSGKSAPPIKAPVVNKKSKKVKVPQKYQQVLQDLIADKSDCIDFTNAELGDAVVIGLCDYIRGTSKLKTLKLIRCKVTDDAMQMLLDACRQSRLSSLNLGQNLLTQETLQLMGKMDLGQIKSITLSQNKINQRNSRNKIAQMKSRGILLSI